MRTNDPQIIAHRGASNAAPENTRAAIALAWQEGADGVEIDVRLTRDGRIAVIHDPDTRRVAGQELVVADSNFEELAQLDVGTHKAPEWSAQTIPPLDEVLTNLPCEKRLWIEVKCGPEILDALVPLIALTPRASTSLAVVSYDDRVLAGVKQALPDVPAFLVARFERPETSDHWTPTTEQLLTTARSAGLDGLMLREVGPLDAAMAREIADAGFGLYVWTVDSPDRARQLIAIGVQGILTNRPGWLRQQLVGGAEI